MVQWIIGSMIIYEPAPLEKYNPTEEASNHKQHGPNLSTYKQMKHLMYMVLECSLCNICKAWATAIKQGNNKKKHGDSILENEVSLTKAAMFKTTLKIQK